MAKKEKVFKKVPAKAFEEKVIIVPEMTVRGKKYRAKVKVDISFEDLVKLTVSDGDKK